MANKAELLAVGGDRSPTRAREDYVKAIYQMGSGEPVRAAAVARYLAVSRVSVSKAKRLLESDGLLEHGAAAEPASPDEARTKACGGDGSATPPSGNVPARHAARAAGARARRGGAHRARHLRRRRLAHRYAAAPSGLRSARAPDSLRRLAAENKPQTTLASLRAGSQRARRKPRRSRRPRDRSLCRCRAFCRDYCCASKMPTTRA